MTRYALTIHPDDRDLWLRMTDRDETRPYECPRLESTSYMEESAAREGVRILEVREIPEEPS
ncbi:hypothetical protein ABT369_38985 [Dactylosporangium sp. NPDC000244]|uniref:hypothetical protein n=1 Tax=Dactylosporangium sp. NPDC000244 TaxID=3154365 RepID=UPI0033349345